MYYLITVSGEVSTGTMANYDVMLKFTDSNIHYSFWESVNADGQNILFSQDDEILSRDILLFDKVNRIAYIKVKFNYLSNFDTSIKMKITAQSGVNDPETYYAYDYVYPLWESVGVFLNRTSLGCNGNQFGGVTYNQNGFINKGVLCGYSSGVDFGDLYLTYANKAEFSVYVSLNNLAASSILFKKYKNGTNYIMVYTGSNNIYFEVNQAYAAFNYTGIINEAQMYKLTFRFDGTQPLNADRLKILINNNVQAAPVIGDVPATLGDLFGSTLRISDASYGWPGIFEWFSVSTAVNKGDDWYKTQYNIDSNPSAAISILEKGMAQRGRSLRFSQGRVSYVNKNDSDETVMNIGNPSVDGSWRIVIEGPELVEQKRENGIWVTKQTAF